jgi:hypothetical protein
LVDALKDYSAQKFYADAMAGFTVGIVAHCRFRWRWRLRPA